MLALVATAALAPAAARADEDTREKPLAFVGTPTTISASTTTWTAVPAASTLTRRSGIKFSNPASNTGVIVGVLSIGAPTVATTVRPIEVQPGENPFIPCADGLTFYILSLATAPENVHAQEVRQ